MLQQRELDKEQMSRLQGAFSHKGQPDEELIKEMYHLIDKVIVYSNREIEIFWKLNDCFQTTMKG